MPRPRHGSRRRHVRRLNNSFWFAHERLGSAARAAYGSVYAVPEALGRFDVVTLGSVLLHLHDPFFALMSALRLAGEAAVITDVPPPGHRLGRLRAGLAGMAGGLLGRRRGWLSALAEPRAAFLPDPLRREPLDTWWRLTPELVARMAAVLGFGRAKIRFHRQLHRDRPLTLFTVVAHRTCGQPPSLSFRLPNSKPFKEMRSLPTATTCGLAGVPRRTVFTPSVAST
jgi:hypothetical protein